MIAFSLFVLLASIGALIWSAFQIMTPQERRLFSIKMYWLSIRVDEKMKESLLKKGLIWLLRQL